MPPMKEYTVEPLKFDLGGHCVTSNLSCPFYKLPLIAMCSNRCYLQSLCYNRDSTMIWMTAQYWGWPPKIELWFVDPHKILVIPPDTCGEKSRKCPNSYFVWNWRSRWKLIRHSIVCFPRKLDTSLSIFSICASAINKWI